MILVDTNILIDVITDDPEWAAWSLAQLERLGTAHRLAINPVVYAELAPRYDSPAQLDRLLSGAGLQVVEMDRRALFLAGKAHEAYRRRGGTRTGVLSDFFIGAQALVLGVALLTRDEGRYKTCFGRIELLTPGG